ncbi:hypothetical protein QBC43DRAFT_335094 [Cladorrhinum sp. PSN259]|nr:hypothetical protein QBC43DRAFT_335094 [Cladorrhinum sp. PSN259]
MGFADRLKERLKHTRSMNHLVAPDPKSAGDVYSGVNGWPNPQWHAGGGPHHVSGPSSYGSGVGWPMLGAIPEADSHAAGGGYYNPSSPSTPLPNPQKRPLFNGNVPSNSSPGFNFGSSYNNSPRTAPTPSPRDSLSPLESAPSGASSTNTYQTDDTGHSFFNNKLTKAFPSSSHNSNTPFPKPDAHLSGHSTTGGDFSDPKASNAEVQRCIKLLRQLFELRIKIWGMRKAHWSTQGRRSEAKRQAKDLHRDINQIVVDWNSMPRSTWTIEEAEVIYAIGKELEGLVPFWDERVEVDNPNS